MHFSAVVVCCNEARHLGRCLERLAFCDERLVIDLGSTDESVAIARAAGARVVAHERVPIVEPLREKALAWVRHDWVIFCDPDEIQPAGLEGALRAAIDADPRLGLIGVRSRYHFLGRPLHCTAWGVCAPKDCVAHRDRVELSPHVHIGLRPKSGFTRAVAGDASLAIEHRWVDSLAQLLEKHRRYLAREGEARFASGQRYRTARALRDVATSAKRNLWDHRAWRGGPTGWFLTAFHVWYTAMAWRSLARFERARSAAQRAG